MTADGTAPSTNPPKTSRRFCLAPAFARLIRRERPAVSVVEGHFPDQSERRSFVSMEGGRCLLVLEERDAGGAVEEERIEVSRAQGEVLLDVCAGRATFERISLETAAGTTIHVEHFISPVTASFVEVRFQDPASAAAFRPPSWLGAELGPDDVGDARRIALGGRPRLFEGPIHNSALDALLDLLDQRPGLHRGGDEQMMSALRRLVRQPIPKGEVSASANAERKIKADPATMIGGDAGAAVGGLKRTNGSGRGSGMV